MKEKIPECSDELFDSNEDFSDPCDGSEDDYVPDTTDSSESSPSTSISVSPKSKRVSTHFRHSRRGGPARHTQSSAGSPAACFHSSHSHFETPVATDSSTHGSTKDSNQQQHSHFETPVATDSSTHGSTEDSGLSRVVPAFHKRSDGGRVYNKKQHCLFCGLAVLKISRHLERRHANEVEVARAVSFPKGSRERRMQLEFIRNKGNFSHNATVMESGIGKLVPCKRPKEDQWSKDFMHCAYCQGYFSRKSLWRHLAVCKFKPSDYKTKPGKNRVQSLCSLTSPAPPGFQSGFWQLLKDMNQDKVVFEIRNDWCIMELGKHMYRKYGLKLRMHEYIRQRMRELGRLLVCAKEITPLRSINELTLPANFMHTVHAVKRVGGYNPDTDTYKIASIALKLGHSLNKIAMILESQATMKGDEDKAKEARNFQKIYHSRWHEYISASALRTLTEAKWNAPQLLPLTEDVKLLHSYLDEKEQHCRQELLKVPSAQTWSGLTKVTLAQIILFNRRREGEVSRMPLSAYTGRDTAGPNPDVSLALSELERRLCQHFQRIELRGKRGRKVAVLLTPAMKESLNLLAQKRKECGVLPENTYLFARPSAMSNYRGTDCLREYAVACGAKNPSTLSSTKLRKQIGTLSKVLNLSNTELDQLADFLGHDINVHRQFYRLPEGTLQLAKLSKVLLALEKGRLAEFSGMNLDEICIDPEGIVNFVNIFRSKGDCGCCFELKIMLH